MRVRLAPLFLFALAAAALARADQTVTIAPGEQIIWNWVAGPHTTTSDPTSGPEVWDSGVQFFGASFSHTFTTPGTYPYHCSVHSFAGGTIMNGVVQVVAATATPTAVAPPTPTPTPGAGGVAVPDLGLPGRLVLAAVLAAAALFLLLTRSR